MCFYTIYVCKGLLSGMEATGDQRSGSVEDRDIVKMNPGGPLSFPNSNGSHLNSCYCREKHGVKKYPSPLYFIVISYSATTTQSYRLTENPLTHSYSHKLPLFPLRKTYRKHFLKIPKRVEIKCT